MWGQSVWRTGGARVSSLPKVRRSLWEGSADGGRIPTCWVDHWTFCHRNRVAGHRSQGAASWSRPGTLLWRTLAGYCPARVISAYQSHSFHSPLEIPDWFHWWITPATCTTRGQEHWHLGESLEQNPQTEIAQSMSVMWGGWFSFWQKWITVIKATCPNDIWIWFSCIVPVGSIICAFLSLFSPALLTYNRHIIDIKLCKVYSVLTRCT